MRPAVLLACCVLLAAGEPTLPDEAVAALARQAEAHGPVTAGPAVVGTWIWGGRADIEYRPFFEWDLRLAAGPRALAQVRARIATLGPKQEVLREGAWAELGAFAAGEARDVPIRMNCPTFGAWRLELAWDGGTETFVSGDKQGIPIAIGDARDAALLLAVNAQAEPDKRGKGLTVTWNLWNLGGAPATGVVQTVRLRKDGKPVPLPGAEVKLSQPVPPRSSTEQRLVIAKPPAYDSLGIEVRSATPAAGGDQVLEPPEGTGPEMAVRRLVLGGGRLTAELVNRLGRAAPAGEVTVVFSHGGKPVAEVRLPTAPMADAATAAPSAPLPAMAAWDEYSVGWMASP